MLFAGLFAKEKKNYAIVANNLYGAQKIYEFLLNFFNEDDVVFYPADELLRAEVLSSSRDLLSQRLYAMNQLLSDKKKILITHPAALLRYLPDPNLFKELRISLKVGDKVDLKLIKEKLSELGYQNVNKIDQSLQYATRGDIIDVSSVNSLYPCRIELFDDEIESIRLFDIATQSSVISINSIDILPATEFLLSNDEIIEFSKNIESVLDSEGRNLTESNKETLYLNVKNDVSDILERNYKPRLYKYFSFASSKFSILDYFPSIDDIFIFSKEGFNESYNHLKEESEEYFLELSNSFQIIKNLHNYLTFDDAIKDKKLVSYGSKFLKNSDSFELKVSPIISSFNGLSSILPTLQSYIKMSDKVVIALADSHQREIIENILQEANIDYEKVKGYELPINKVGISDANLNVGFEIMGGKLTYISSSELFGHHVNNSRYIARFKNATILKSYEDLKPGDYVVHEYHGIGQFIGIKTMFNDGVQRDYLHLAYTKNQTLFVPLEQFRLVRKYSGREGFKPKLSSLTGNDWKKRKERIEEKVNDLADRLISLYGTRAKIDGFAYPMDDELQKRFEDEFPYELTLDQQKAVDEIKEDMEKPEVMDRLLCGDVGFGKTEVAFRAAFKAINAHKQVAILCPTTLLARQHYEVALSRFATFGIHIALFSRLVSSKVQQEDIKKVKNGEIDLIIGTHRLLSKDITFKDLGLLIVDEEQRFGVEQKEKIKEIKNNVDVLSLSATPIPRTLQMSLVGIRALSEINTAPSNRMPIQTYVIPYKEEVVYELIGRELARDGQVFYIHNRVNSIYAKVNELVNAIPSIKIGVIHGQMEKSEIEETMEQFYDGKINVLVATSIIENGIDVANANMLIVEDADYFGLSQLYQIKGRVGRGNRIAYAYLCYKENKNINEDAQKRLEAIQEFNELGSGYKIAQRDLLIRGAGDMLGKDQAGFIDSIGLDLYLKMLNEAIEEKKTGVRKNHNIKAKTVFSINAYIPKDYASNADKISLYQELGEIESEAELKKFISRVRDVYGRLPIEVETLIKKKKIDLIADNDEFEYVQEEEKNIDILLNEKCSRVDGIGLELFNALTPYLSIVSVSFLNKKVRIQMQKSDAEWLDTLEKLLKLIHAVFLRCSHN